MPRTFHKGAGGVAKPQIIEGIRFASKAEARRYTELKMLEKAGVIHSIIPHPKFEFWINGAPLKDKDSGRKITYSADFFYLQNGAEKLASTALSNRDMIDTDGRFRFAGMDYVIEDVKGFRRGKPLITPEYRIKGALMLSVWGVRVLEVP